MMKRTISALLVCVLLVGCVFALASCGKTLSGKYEAKVVGTGASYEFNGSKVTITASILGFEKNFEGTYEIKKNDKDVEVIVFTFEDKDAENYSGEFTFVEGKEGETSYIKIGGIQYNKVD